eukprot:scaffold351076_cov38-Prasinocladus_malaysianus.AAC.1
MHAAGLLGDMPVLTHVADLAPVCVVSVRLVRGCPVGAVQGFADSLEHLATRHKRVVALVHRLDVCGQQASRGCTTTTSLWSPVHRLVCSLPPDASLPILV